MYTNIIHNDDICNYFLKNQQFIFNSLGNCRECRLYRRLSVGSVSSSVSGAGSLGLEDRYGRKITSMIKIKQEYYPDVIVTTPEECTACTGAYGAPLGGADVVIEVAGSEDSFQLAWQSARPNATVTVVALYDRPQILPLPVMYGKNLTFKTGGVDGCDVPSFFRL